MVLAIKGELGETYNIGATEEYSNLEVAEMVCAVCCADFDSRVEFVPDRPFNDRRYALAWEKVAGLGWKPRRRMAEDLPALVQWYRENQGALRQRQSGPAQ